MQHRTDERDAAAALGDFTRFPRWMWRNRDVVAFLEWLRAHNATQPMPARTGFYGLDLYSLHASIDSVLGYLGTVDPDAAARARQRYSCFDHFGEDTQAYGYAAWTGLTSSCETEVVAQLTELRRRAADYARGAGHIAADEYFFAEQNARLVRNAEEYYRAMFGDRVDSWNRRDTHMMETLEALMAHVRATAGNARAVVWAHNSHLGDARATQMSMRGELNLGQLVREAYGSQARSIGFTTHTGTVTAASDWGEPAERMHVVPSLPGSYERLFHEAAIPDFVLRLDRDGVRDALRISRLERAIGVIYRPRTERVSHYFRAQLSDQFDVVVHMDETHAVEPLERWPADAADPPETYPTAL